jgi:ATP-dependent protease ClpP protease subunit
MVNDMEKKETKANTIIDLAEKLVGLRKKPLLVFDVDPVSPQVVLMTEHELLGKDYPEIDVLIHTLGGHIESAFNITKLLRTTAKKINVLIPHKAKSAGTLICLGADNIIMSPISELGPLDTQIRESQDGDAETYKSALNGFKALEQVQKHAFDNLDLAAKMLVSRSGLKMAEAVKLAIDFSGKTSSCLYNQLNPITIGEYARALEVGELYGINILTRYLGWSEEKAANTVKRLVYVLRFVLLQEDIEGSKITIKLIEPPKPSKPKTRAKKTKNVTRKK